MTGPNCPGPDGHGNAAEARPPAPAGLGVLPLRQQAGRDSGPGEPALPLPLDTADQFTLPWTNYGNVYTDSLDLRDPFADTLKSSHKDVATPRTALPARTTSR